MVKILALLLCVYSNLTKRCLLSVHRNLFKIAVEWLDMNQLALEPTPREYQIHGVVHGRARVYINPEGGKYLDSGRVDGSRIYAARSGLVKIINNSS